MIEQTGEKTEQPTPRRLEEAARHGQFARSAEIQTVMVVGAGVLAMVLAGNEIWRVMRSNVAGILGHLHDLPISQENLQGHLLACSWVGLQCAGPVILATVLGGLLAGGLQSRFQTASEALEVKWERLDPVAGFQRLFSFRSAVPTGLAMVKLFFILALSYSEIKAILNDPIFTNLVNTARIAEFIAQTSYRLLLRVGAVLLVIAAIDYAYQFWQTHRDLMMTKDEVKEEMKSSEGNPQIKAAQKRRHRRSNQRKMMMDVARADVVITNPTRLAVALRYDRRTMRAPRILAKGTRLNALRIREIAQQHQIPTVENKPLARLLFKYGKVGGEIPAQLYAAVAEVLAWVYRVNRYRYYTEQNRA